MSAAAADAPLADVETEDTALIMFRTVNDVAGSAVISQLSAGRKNRLWIEVDGMHHSAVFDQEHPEQLWLGAERGQPDPGPRPQPRLGRAAAAVLAARRSRPGLRPVLRELRRRLVRAVDAYDGGAAPEGLPTFADGARAAAICDAMLRSAETQAVDDGHRRPSHDLPARAIPRPTLAEVGGKGAS